MCDGITFSDYCLGCKFCTCETFYKFKNINRQIARGGVGSLRERNYLFARRIIMKSALGIMLSFIGTMILAMDEVKEKQLERPSAGGRTINIGLSRAKAPSAAAVLEEPVQIERLVPLSMNLSGESFPEDHLIARLQARMGEVPSAGSVHEASSQANPLPIYEGEQLEEASNRAPLLDLLRDRILERPASAAVLDETTQRVAGISASIDEVTEGRPLIGARVRARVSRVPTRVTLLRDSVQPRRAAQVSLSELRKRQLEKASEGINPIALFRAQSIEKRSSAAVPENSGQPKEARPLTENEMRARQLVKSSENQASASTGSVPVSMNELRKRHLERAAEGSNSIARFRAQFAESRPSAAVLEDSEQPAEAKPLPMDELKKKGLEWVPEDAHSHAPLRAEKPHALLEDPAQRTRTDEVRNTQSGSFIGLSRARRLGTPASAAALPLEDSAQRAGLMRLAKNELREKPGTSDHPKALRRDEMPSASTNSERSVQSAAVHEGFSRNAAALLSPRHERQYRERADDRLLQIEALDAERAAAAEASLQDPLQAAYSITTSLLVNGENIPTKCSFSILGKRLMIVREGMASVINILDCEKIETVNLWSDPSKRRSITSMAFEGRVGIAGMSDGLVELWTVDMDLNHVTHYLLSKNFGGPITEVTLQCTDSGKGRRGYSALAAAADGTMRHYAFDYMLDDGIRNVDIAEVKDRPLVKSCLAESFLDDCVMRALTVSSEGTVIFREMKGRFRRALQFGNIWNLESNALIIDCATGSVRFNTQSANPHFARQPLEKSPVLVAGSPSLSEIALAEGGKLRFWVPHGGSELLMDDASVISALDMNKRTIVAGIKGEVHVFNYDPANIDFTHLDVSSFVIEGLSGTVTNLALSKDSNWLAIATDGQHPELYLCNFIHRNESRTLPLPRPTSKVTSLSIRLLVESKIIRILISSEDGSVVLHDIEHVARSAMS